MLKECIQALEIKPSGKYVDATFGGGGHSRAILEQLNSDGRLYAFDQDRDAAKNIVDDERLIFVPQNFRHLRRFLKVYEANSIDGILADLGISSHQIDTPERGFSIRYEASLDMRMDLSLEATAAAILNTYSAEQLQNIFSTYGELRNSKTLAELIVKERLNLIFTTTTDFISRIGSCIRGHRPRYLAQVFQALRMEVNQEMNSLEDLMKQSSEVLNKGGRMVVLTYHSLEDRMVKNFFKAGNATGEEEKDLFGHSNKIFSLANKKPITATEIEIKENSRARSAKLRTAIKN